MKVAIIGNCQAAGIASALRVSPDIESVDVVSVHLRSAPDFISKSSDLLSKARSGEVSVVSFNLSAEFGNLSTDSLRPIAKNYRTITNSFFSGLHPDMTYLGGMGRRVQGPLGDYHSKIILCSYLNGLSVDECSNLFCEEVYEGFGFFREFESSLNELKARDESIDIKLSPFIESFVTTHPLFMTINHPTSILLVEAASRICSHLGLRKPEFPFSFYENPIANNVWWPIYAEIGGRHSVAYSTPLLFKQAVGMGGKAMDLETVIRELYATYDTQERGFLMSTNAAKAILKLSIPSGYLLRSNRPMRDKVVN